MSKKNEAANKLKELINEWVDVDEGVTEFVTLMIEAVQEEMAVDCYVCRAVQERESVSFATQEDFELPQEKEK